MKLIILSLIVVFSVATYNDNWEYPVTIVAASTYAVPANTLALTVTYPVVDLDYDQLLTTIGSGPFFSIIRCSLSSDVKFLMQLTKTGPAGAVDVFANSMQFVLKGQETFDWWSENYVAFETPIIITQGPSSAIGGNTTHKQLTLTIDSDEADMIGYFLAAPGPSTGNVLNPDEHEELECIASEWRWTEDLNAEYFEWDFGYMNYRHFGHREHQVTADGKFEFLLP